MTPDLKYVQEGEVAYFAGCSTSFSGSTRNLAVNAVRLLNKARVEPVYLGTDEWCCGGAMFVVGCLDDILETVSHNLDEWEKRGVKALITSCLGLLAPLGPFLPGPREEAEQAFQLEGAAYHPGIKRVHSDRYTQLQVPGESEGHLPRSLSHRPGWRYLPGTTTNTQRHPGTGSDRDGS